MARPVECIGMKVDAYVLNPSVVAETYFVAPTTRPSYDSLLPGPCNLRHDVVPPVDVRNAFPWQHNSRIADLLSGQVIKSRLGVYLHWCVPKLFRSGKADASEPSASPDGLTSEYPASETVEYEPVPDRWLVFRHVAESQPSTSLAPALEVFLVESSKIRKVNDVIAAGEDLETAASPFLDPGRATEDQLRTVLGRVSHLTSDWDPGAGGADSRAAAADEGYLSLLTVLETGNTLFADYSPHNAAVFTLHDDLTWGGQLPGSTESATISYVVYGFRAKDARQLLSSPPDISTSTSTSAAAPVVDKKPVRVCWGSLYSVKYHRSDPPSIINAAIVAKNFAEKESAFSSVLDRLSSYAALPESNSQLDRAGSSTTNFKSAHGGYRWRLATDEGQDGSCLMIPEQWWKHRSLHGETDVISRQRRAQAVRRARSLLERMEVTNSLLTSTARLIVKMEEDVKPYGSFTKGENRKFHSHTDPIFALRDVGSGWPAEWGSDASVITSSQFDSWLSSSPFSQDAAPRTKSRIPDVWDRFVGHPGLARLPGEMMSARRNIMMPGCCPLVARPSWTESVWNGQPWLPLFVDELWEMRHNDDGTVRYGLRGDISLGIYSLSSRTFSGRAILSPDAQKTMLGLIDMMYRTVPGAVDTGDAGMATAQNILSGIQLLFGRLDGFTDHLLTLCQGAHVAPSLDNIALDTDDDPLITSLITAYRAAEEIFADEDDLKLLSGHLKLPGNSPDRTDAVGGLDVTPYGISHEGLSYPSSQNLNSPADKDLFFRPVSQGQARLTQFKIVDRFGQVICATDPRPDQPAPSFYPHMGTGILCETLPIDNNDASEPRTAFPLKPEEIASGDCPWFQLSPRINQDARIHADFMRNRTLPNGLRCDGKYQPVAAGERAVFAWLLINFHNRSLQVYDGDGAFKGEAFLPSGPDEPVYWQSLLGRGDGQDILPHMLPHESSAAPASVGHEGSASFELPMSLEDLLVSMSHAPFLIQLWDTVVTAQDHLVTPPPQQYAQIPSALVGRPLALAHLGLGVGLATAPMRSQAYADYSEEYPADDEVAGDVIDSSETTGDEELTRYAFAVKLGDMLGRQSGLVAYFRPPAPDKLPQPGAWTITTDYTPKSPPPPPPPPSYSSSSVHVQHSTVSRESLDAATVSTEVQDYQQRRAESLHASIVTVLVDPYLPVHVRSGILPVAIAQLSRAIVEHDMGQLGVWLRTGPVLIGARGTDPAIDGGGGGAGTAPPSRPRVPVQPVMVNEPPYSSIDRSRNEERLQAALNAPVNYVRLGTMNPLRTGFDAAVGVDDETLKRQEAEIAVALEGYLLLETRGGA
ncbi:hypothetical protein F5Y14DRAFT_442836 [Nemania sp. NC0429]|nr:hypothetical protein F5Y14DRAFT_442836 [Nemania sp. NC0429]